MSGDASPQPQPAATALAPGFRFHPTDEELVSYYLKRKVFGRPFPFDAISEIDLYKSEPWDLPSKSHLQSRDMEWYFFSALDKKYANRSRTNRATGEGYWKTTGKDRPIRRNSRTVGMKKTLVFHIGRAPKGERTNWVMHEYRLEDEDLVRMGIPQDAFVVCRIFQKNGSGPQNGAQYGAPFMEEEWEEDGTLFPKEEDGEDGLIVVRDPSFIQQNQDMGVQNETAAPFLVSDDDQDSFNDLVDANSLLEICQGQEITKGMDKTIEVLEPHDGQNLNGMDENSSATAPNQDLAALNDGYLELNDFANSVVADGWENVACPEGVHSGQNFVNCENNQQELHDIEEFFDTLDENGDLSEPFQLSPTVENNLYMELHDLVNPSVGDYPSDEPTDDGMVRFDAPSHYPPGEHGCFLAVDALMDSTMANSSGPDLVDELLAHFDATENLELSTLDSGSVDSSTLIQFDHAPEVNGGSIQAYQTFPQPSEANGDNVASSMSLEAGDQPSFKSDDGLDGRDVRSDIGWDKTLTKRLVGVLGSISSPPAFAAEYPMKGTKSPEHYSATHSSSSIHITAGMIKINGLTVTGNGKNWSVQKNGDVSFLLSYGMKRDVVGNPVSFEPMAKMHGGLMSFLLRNSFHLLFLSTLFFAASFKIGICICNR